MSFLPLRDVWEHAPRPIEWRVASSVCLVLLAWSTVIQHRRSNGTFQEMTGIRRLTMGTAWGMTWGCLGDAWALPAESSLPIPRLLGAMILFGIGHLAYLWAFLAPKSTPVSRPLRTARSRILVMVVWWILATLAWWLTASDVPQPHLRWPALGYAWLIGVIAGVGTLRAMSEPRWVRIALGIGLFFLSDFILAWQSFRGSFPLGSDLCWVTYGPGQMLIVWGVRRSVVP